MVASETNDLTRQLRQNRLVLLIGLLCGIAGAVLIYFYLSGKDKEYSERTAVVAVDALINRGDVISADKLVKKTVPVRFSIPNAVPWNEAATIQGTRALVNLQEGQIITWDFLEVTTLKRTFSDKLDSTQRALTMPADEFSGVAGHINAGDRVDVVGMFAIADGQNSKRVAKTILQCVPVLSVGYRGSRINQSYNSITLQVSPLEAELLIFAETQGRLKYLLRNRENIAIEDIEMVDFSNLEVVKQKTNKTKRARVRYANERKK